MERLDERNVNFDVYRSALILWAAGMEEPVVVDKPCGQVDILPTVSNLLGLEYDSPDAGRVGSAVRRAGAGGSSAPELADGPGIL